VGPGSAAGAVRAVRLGFRRDRFAIDALPPPHATAASRAVALASPGSTGDGGVAGAGVASALLEQNTRLTRVTQELTQRIKELTDGIHRRVAPD